MPALTGLWVGDGGVTRHGRAGWLHLPGGENDTAEPIRCHFQALRQASSSGRRRCVLASPPVCVTSGWRRREHHAQVSAGGRAGAP